tara:strand:+ start:490 stop:876 length:387 start_codon:yes stop_codon:yes gene_type:complete
MFVIFSGLSGWLRRRQIKKRRKLFWYFDGVKEQGIDPLKTIYDIEADEEFNAATHPVMAAEGDSEAYQICQNMICRVFGVHPYDPETGLGLTEAERMELFSEFDYFLGSQKKNGAGTPKSPDSTEEST